MVSFSCEGCGDVLTKKKLDSHKNQCRGATFTCLDCMVHFYGTDYRSHTSCISEAQKYQGALYRPEKEKKGKQNGSKALVPQRAYVEDAQDDYNGAITIVDPPLPEAPSPPSAVPGFKPEVNVFDFMVGSETPNPSTLDFTAAAELRRLGNGPLSPTTGNTPAVRFQDYEDKDDALIQYGSGPVPTSAFRTPAAKSERKKKDRDLEKDEKKDKKRKRLHVDTHDRGSSVPGDQDEVMADAPPVLHSGLTGGLGRLLSRPEDFPPTPDYSGADAGEVSPGSPLKRSKHSKREKDGRGDTFSNTIMQLISTRSSKDEERARKQRKHKNRVGSEKPSQKLIEYKSTKGQGDGSQQMVLYEAPAEMFMSFINKGPDSEKGCSMNKALKRYHRERTALGVGLGKVEEEKDLWRSLRLKKNDRGEVVLFF